MSKPVIYWFRQDLRLVDLPALIAAAKAGPVVPVFIWDEGLGGGDRQEGWGTLDLNAADPVKLPCRARPAEAPQANSVRPWLLGVKIFVSSRAGP